MKKRLLSWLLVLTMVISLVPSTLITTAFAAENPSAQASGQAGKTTHTMVDELPSDLSAYDIWDVRLTKDTQPGGKITVPNGKTLIIHGTGGIAGGTRNDSIVVVEKGGHLVLDEVLIQNNAVGSDGAIYVKSGGLLDLGYNDQSSRRAPSITNNKFNSAAKNLVIEDGATVRLNAQADKAIGVSYYKDDIDVGPFIAISGGRYTMRGTQEGNINGETGITSDDTAKWKLMYSYDNLIMHNPTPRVLVWDPVDFWSYEGTTSHRNAAYNVLKNYHKYNTDLIRGSSVRNTIKATRHLTDTELGSIDQYDLIAFDCPLVELTNNERSAFLEYLNNGGRILVLVENAQSTASTDKRNNMNTTASKVAQSLGADFTAQVGEHVPDSAQVTTLKSPARVAELTKDFYGTWNVFVGAYITSGKNVYPLATGKTNKGHISNIICDQDAGDRDGSQWGALTVVGDADMFWNKPLGVGRPLLKNLVENTVSRRVSAAAGVNPNSGFNEWQATTTTTTTTTETTDYRTPYAALQKAVENNTVTLLLNSRGGAVNPTRDELLFEKSTLAYEAGSTYDGSTIHADTAGVYLDITKTGAVNLRSGTVTVTPKDANYPLVLNGTMDTDGNAITGGYKITSATPYQLDADDDTTKIKAGNGGGASITIPTAGTSVTVAYTGGTDGKLNGKTITYTATEDNEKFYLGCYTVSYEVEGNVTWTETDLAWDGHDFETKMTPATGFDAHGEKLAVVDIANSKTYDMENGGTEGTGTETWGVFNSKTKLKDSVTPKITVKQQYLHENNVDRNGYATVTVRNVREDITIRTTGNAVESSRPNIYVVGVGVKDGQRTQLWAYTTQRTTDDQVTTKDVEGWPWAKWKVVSAKTAKGTQAAYEGNQITTWTNQTIKNSTTAGGALCPVKLTQGDMVVVFQYEWDMVNVKINAKLGEGGTAVDFPGYTTQYAEVQRDVESTIYAPNLSGYQPTAASTTITPTKGTDGNYGPYEVTFYYKLAMGQVIYRAVDAGGHELATWDGPRVLQGDTVSTDYALAPKLAGYQVKQQNGNATAANSGTTDKYDGVNQITVTWVYEPKTRDVEVKMVEYDASKPNNIGAELRTDTTSYANSPVGFTLNLAAPAIPGYTVKEVADNDEISKSKSVFVEDNDQGKLTVYFYYEVNTQDEAKITVQMWDKVNNEEIWSYTVPGQNGEKQLVRVPTVKGYVSDTSNKDVSIAPDETINADWGKGTVRFLYSPNTVKVTVKLVDSTKTANDADYELNTKVPNYTGSYTVVKGESIDIVAPDVYGYTLADGQDSVHKLTVDKNESKTELTYTIQYKNTASANYVTHTIILNDVDNNKEITRYNNIVAKGTGKTTYYAPVQDGYQVDALTKEGDNSQSEEITFNYSKSAAIITIHFVDKTGKALTGAADTELSGYEKGQTVMVSAPALTNYALAGQWKNGKLEAMTGVTATLTLSKTKTNNEITFAYEDRGDVTFVLKDKAGKDIQVINGVAGQKYSVAENGKLDLRTSGWAFDASHQNNSTDFKTANASVTVAQGASGTYELHYTRITRDVTYKYWDVTNGEANKTEINFTSNDNPTPVNVGENFTAAAPQIAGYTANALRVVTFVMYDANNAAVEVNFNYIRKATGSVTVEHIVKNGSEEKVITSYTASGSVGEWFTATALTTDASGITTDGKYKFTESATNKKTQTVKVGADAQTIKFVYEPNYVTVKTYTSVAGAKTEYQTGIEVVKTTGSQKLYAPSMTGYVLKGIEVKQGSNTDGGAKTFPSTGWNNNVLTLTGLTNDVEVVYYYEKINDNIKEYQATVTVKDQYASYELGSWTETVTKDVSSTITPKPHDGYILSGYQIGDSAGQKQTITKDQVANFVLKHKFTADTNVTFFYDRADGSAVVPGEDTKFGTEDDVIIKPNGDKLPTVNADKSVNVPNGAEVVTPNGTVIPPDGSIVKPDGTIVAPDANGKTDPGVTIDPSNPDSAKATYLYVKYLANGGKGEIPTQFFKKGTEITLATNSLTADNKTANGWNTQENGQGKDYTNGATLTPTESMTLYAKWTASNYTHKVTITFNANTGANSATKTQVIGSYTSTAFGGTLDANTFTLDGWTFRGWNTAQNGGGTAYTNEQEVTFTSASGDTLTLYAQWYRFNKDGSITVPGSDSTPNTDKDVTIHPNGNDKPSIDDKGNVKVPNGAEVTTPNGTIIPPNGSIVKPDGTIVAPDDNGSTEPGIEIDPSKPGDATNKFITVTYKYGRTDKQVADVVQYGKGTVTIMTGNPFTAPTGYQFDGWKIEGSNDKFTGTEVNASTTLVAQWKLAGSVTLAPDKSTDSGKRLETGAKDGELKLVMRGDWAQDKTLTLGALVDGKQSTNEVYWRVDADSYKNEFGFTNSVLTGDQIVSVDANTGKLTVLNSGIVRVWCISKVNPDIKFSVVVVVPGDVNKDGLVDADDIDWTYCAMADPTFIPTQDEDDAKTWYIKDLAILHSTAADKEIGADDIDCLYNILFGIYGF